VEANRLLGSAATHVSAARAGARMARPRHGTHRIVHDTKYNPFSALARQVCPRLSVRVTSDNCHYQRRGRGYVR